MIKKKTVQNIFTDQYILLIIVLIVTWVSVSSVEPGSDQSSEWWQVAVLWVSCLACWSRDQIRERREESPVLTRALTWVIWISWHNNMKPDLTRVTWCHWPTAHPRGLTWSLMWKRNLDQILPKQQESLRSNSNYFEVFLAASASATPDLTRVTWCHWPTAHPRGLTWSLHIFSSESRSMKKHFEALRSQTNPFSCCWGKTWPHQCHLMPLTNCPPPGADMEPEVKGIRLASKCFEVILRCSNPPVN